MSQCESGEWRDKFKFTFLSTSVLNGIFDEAEHKVKTRNVRTHIGSGSGRWLEFGQVVARFEIQPFNQTFIDEGDGTMWNMLTNIIPHRRTIVQVITPDTEMFKMAVGDCTQIIDSNFNDTHIHDDFLQTKKDFLTDDRVLNRTFLSPPP